MIRVRYEPIADRVETYAVSIVGPQEWLVGYAHKSDNGLWTARARSVTMRDAVSGWLRRGDAARWLLISQGFAQEPEASSERWAA